MQPKVSVIVPCYNHAEFIEICIESIIGQNYPELELIIFNDGSKDDSHTILQNLQSKYEFTYINQANIGLTPTINKALKLITGKYYCVFAGDDIMLPGRLEAQVGLLESRNDLCACGGNIETIDNDGNKLGKARIYSYRELGFIDLFKGLKPGIAAPTAMVRTADALAVGGYREDIAIEDAYMWLKLTHTLNKKIAGMTEVLACYRRHDSNMHDNTLPMVEAMLKIFDDYSSHPDHEAVVNDYLLGRTLKEAKKGSIATSRLLAKKISPRYRCNRKFLKTVFYWLTRKTG